MGMLLTTNTKLNKAWAFGYKSFGIHFAPHKVSGYNVCPKASQGCSDACLYFAGFGAYTKVQTARITRTQSFFRNQKVFMCKLVVDIETQVRRSHKNNLIPTIRLNLTSDVAWELIKIDGQNIFELFPNVQFMDYTKWVGRMRSFVEGKLPSNYHLTFSRSESNQQDVVDVMKLGGNVAVVFRNKLPKTYLKKRVISGMEHDLRFLDRKNCVVGLLALGKRGRADNSGFVIG